MMFDISPEPFFGGPGLDRADALRSQPEAICKLAARPDALQLSWQDGFPHVGGDGTLVWSRPSNPELFLGFKDDLACFSAIHEVTGEARVAFPLLAQIVAQEAPLFATAVSLSRWHSRHRFCANCGYATQIVRAGWSRKCPHCSTEHYPRVDPVVIMLAEHDGKLLLGRQPQYPPGRYSALAGFVEVGETLEDAVARELFEEAGVRVSAVRYIASQPWPFPSSLMIGCHAFVVSPSLQVDHLELEDARWFSRDEVESAIAGGPGAAFEPPPFTAIARTLLEHWLAA